MKRALITLAAIFLLPAAGASIAQDGQYGPPPDATVQGQAPPPYQAPPYSQQAPYAQYPAAPQDPGSQAAQQPAIAAPPPGVGRLSFINGDVSTQRGDNGEGI